MKINIDWLTIWHIFPFILWHKKPQISQIFSKILSTVRVKGKAIKLWKYIYGEKILWHKNNLSNLKWVSISAIKGGRFLPTRFTIALQPLCTPSECISYNRYRFSSISNCFEVLFGVSAAKIAFHIMYPYLKNCHLTIAILDLMIISLQWFAALISSEPTPITHFPIVASSPGIQEPCLVSFRVRISETFSE